MVLVVRTLHAFAVDMECVVPRHHTATAKSAWTEPLCHSSRDHQMWIKHGRFDADGIIAETLKRDLDDRCRDVLPASFVCPPLPRRDANRNVIGMSRIEISEYKACGAFEHRNVAHLIDERHDLHSDRSATHGTRQRALRALKDGPREPTKHRDDRSGPDSNTDADDHLHGSDSSGPERSEIRLQPPTARSSSGERFGRSPRSHGWSVAAAGSGRTG